MIIHKNIVSTGTSVRQSIEFYALDVEADPQRSYIIKKCFQNNFFKL